MRFALFCDDLLFDSLVEALCAHDDGHQLSCAVRVNSRADELLCGRAGIKYLDHWEDLLTARDVDGVFVGGCDPQVLEGVKQLASAGFPILFAPRAEQGSTLIYELSLIHDDNHVTLVPLFWHQFDAACVQLRTILKEGRLGRVQFLQLSHSLARPSSNTSLTQSEIDAELLHDAALLRELIGDYNQVTTLQTAASSEGVLMQSVVLAGRSLPEANWSIKSSGGPEDWRLLVRGEAGEAELSRKAAAQNWVFQWDGNRIEGDRISTARLLISSFASSIERFSKSPSSQLEDGEWGELIKCYETLDASNRSIRRRRTIELHFEPMSERAIFKTQMTAIGCGLLVITFLLTLCYLGVAAVVPLNHSILIVLRTLVFAPLIVFLLAQVLLPLTRPSSNENS